MKRWGRKRLCADPRLAEPTWSSRRINRLLSGMVSATSYLEVGVQFGYTFQAVDAPFRWGVDPIPRFALGSLPEGCRFSAMPSDEFFLQLPPQCKFDLIFLDGLHEWTQTYRDLMNALAHSGPGAIILIDDVVPSDEYSALPDEQQALAARAQAGDTGLQWHGDVYKVLLAVHQLHPELSFRVIDAELGNPQAVVWLNHERELTGTPEPSVSWSDAYHSVGYFDVFDQRGRPREWPLVSEEQAISDALGR